MEPCIFCGSDADTIPVKVNGLTNIQLRPVCDACIAHLRGWQVGPVVMPDGTHKAKITSGEIQHSYDSDGRQTCCGHLGSRG